MACSVMPFLKWALLLPCIVVCLSEGVVMEASIVAVIMEDLNSMLCSVLFEGKLGSKCFVGLVVKLEVDKVEAAEVVNKDGGALVDFLVSLPFSCA